MAWICPLEKATVTTIAGLAAAGSLSLRWHRAGSRQASIAVTVTRTRVLSLVASSRALGCHAGLLLERLRLLRRRLLLVQVLCGSKLQGLGSLVSRILLVCGGFMRELRSSLWVLRTWIARGGQPTVCRLLKQELLVKLRSLRRDVEARLVVVKLKLLVLRDEDLAGARLQNLLLLLVRLWVRGGLIYKFVV